MLLLVWWVRKFVISVLVSCVMSCVLLGGKYALVIKNCLLLVRCILRFCCSMCLYVVVGSRS